MGVCTLVFLIPAVLYTTNPEIIPNPVVKFIRTKWDVGLTPLVVGLGVLKGIATGLAQPHSKVSGSIYMNAQFTGMGLCEP
jgi:hypothetical protein